MHREKTREQPQTHRPDIEVREHQITPRAGTSPRCKIEIRDQQSGSETLATTLIEAEASSREQVGVTVKPSITDQVPREPKSSYWGWSQAPQHRSRSERSEEHRSVSNSSLTTPIDVGESKRARIGVEAKPYSTDQGQRKQKSPDWGHREQESIDWCCRAGLTYPLTGWSNFFSRIPNPKPTWIWRTPDSAWGLCA